MDPCGPCIVSREVAISCQDPVFPALEAKFSRGPSTIELRMPPLLAPPAAFISVIRRGGYGVERVHLVSRAGGEDASSLCKQRRSLTSHQSLYLLPLSISNPCYGITGRSEYPPHDRCQIDCVVYVGFLHLYADADLVLELGAIRL